MDVSEILEPDGQGPGRDSAMGGQGISTSWASAEGDWQGRRMFEDPSESALSRARLMLPVDLQYLTYGEAQVLVKL